MKKKNPRDATMRNVRASRKKEGILANRIDQIEMQILNIAAAIATLAIRVVSLEERVGKKERKSCR